MKHIDHPLVSLTLLTHNRIHDVHETLFELQRIDYPNYEIIVVDNASNEDVAEMIQREFPAVRLIRLDKNIKLRARRISFRAAEGEFIVSLDDDSHPEPNTIQKMVDYFQTHPEIGAIAFHVPCGDFFSTLTWPEGIGNYHYIGCGVGIRKRIFSEVGYYDDLLEDYADDNDFAFRILIDGYSIGHFKDLVVHHRSFYDKKRIFRFFLKSRRNNMYLVWKYVPPRKWLLTYIRYTLLLNQIAWHTGGVLPLLYSTLGCIASLGWIRRGIKNHIVINDPLIQDFTLRNRGYYHSISKQVIRFILGFPLVQLRLKPKPHKYCLKQK